MFLTGRVVSGTLQLTVPRMSRLEAPTINVYSPAGVCHAETDSSKTARSSGSMLMERDWDSPGLSSFVLANPTNSLTSQRRFGSFCVVLRNGFGGWREIC